MHFPWRFLPKLLPRICAYFTRGISDHASPPDAGEADLVEQHARDLPTNTPRLAKNPLPHRSKNGRRVEHEGPLVADVAREERDHERGRMLGHRADEVLPVLPQPAPQQNLAELTYCMYNN